MLRAFLIIWTLVAGVAAGSLMYIVNWGRQAPVTAAQIAPARDRAAAVTTSAGPAAPSPGNAAASGAPETAVTAQSPPAEAAPASTGSLPSASGRSAGRTVRRVDDGLALPPSPEPIAQAVREPPSTSASRNEVAAEGSQPQDAVLPPPRPAASAHAARSQGAVGALPAVDDAEADPDMPRAPAATRPAATKTSDQPSASSLAAAAPVSPPIVSEQATDRARPKADPTPRPRARDVAVRSEPDETSVREEAAQTNRALKRQARLMERRAAREAARMERERLRAAALEPVGTAARPRPAEIRRQARMERRTRMARGGGLEQLLDEFSRSGADYLHERTIRVGTRYLVERTTRHGTQYFYEQNGR